MRKPSHQAAFFRLLAKLFIYMASGNSHIGFLCNNKGNPFVKGEVGFFSDCQVLILETGCS